MSETTANAKTAKASESTAAQREAEDSDVELVEFTVTVKGKEIKLTAPADFDDLPMDAALKMESGKHMNALAEVLGEQQMMKLRAYGTTRKDFTNVFLALNEAWGLGED